MRIGRFSPVGCGLVISETLVRSKRLSEMFSDKDRTKAGRAIAAMMKMQKIDLATLEQAFNGD